MIKSKTVSYEIIGYEALIIMEVTMADGTFDTVASSYGMDIEDFGDNVPSYKAILDGADISKCMMDNEDYVGKIKEATNVSIEIFNIYHGIGTDYDDRLEEYEVTEEDLKTINERFTSMDVKE